MLKGQVESAVARGSAAHFWWASVKCQSKAGWGQATRSPKRLSGRSSRLAGAAEIDISWSSRWFQRPRTATAAATGLSQCNQSMLQGTQ